MGVIEAIEARFSCRAFLPRPLDRATILGIMQAALRAPSWANTQPWEVYAATGEPLERIRAASAARFAAGSPGALDIPAPATWPTEIQERMQAMMADRFAALGIDRHDEAARRMNMEKGARFFDAPAVVWLCMDRSLSNWSLFDLGALSQNIMLAAEGFGIASIPAVMLARHPDLIRAELGVPDHLAVAIGIALGYPDMDSPQNKYRSKRRLVEEAVRLKGF